MIGKKKKAPKDPRGKNTGPKAKLAEGLQLEVKERKGGGGKLSRTETVTVRFDPKLRFALELASRRQRRTVSSFIEWAVDQAVRQEKLFPEKSSSLTIHDATERIWDVEDSERFVNLANHHPHLLTHEEEVLWKLIKTMSFLWLSPESLASDEKEWEKKLNKLDFIRLRGVWKDLNKAARGEISDKDIPLVEDSDSPYPSDFLPGGK